MGRGSLLITLTEYLHQRHHTAAPPHRHTAPPAPAPMVENRRSLPAGEYEFEAELT
jgi:hypothetical protein